MRACAFQKQLQSTIPAPAPLLPPHHRMRACAFQKLLKCSMPARSVLLDAPLLLGARGTGRQMRRCAQGLR